MSLYRLRLCRSFVLILLAFTVECDSSRKHNTKSQSEGRILHNAKAKPALVPLLSKALMSSFTMDTKIVDVKFDECCGDNPTSCYHRDEFQRIKKNVESRLKAHRIWKRGHDVNLSGEAEKLKKRLEVDLKLALDMYADIASIRDDCEQLKALAKESLVRIKDCSTTADKLLGLVQQTNK